MTEAAAVERALREVRVRDRLFTLWQRVRCAVLTRFRRRPFESPHLDTARGNESLGGAVMAELCYWCHEPLPPLPEDASYVDEIPRCGTTGECPAGSTPSATDRGDGRGASYHKTLA